MRIVHVCPKGCGDRFHAVVQKVAVWVVDGLGNFIEESDNSAYGTPTPSNDSIWACIKCGEEAVILDETAFADSFEYGGFHFRPYRQFKIGEVVLRLSGDSREWKTDAQYTMRNMRSDFSLGISAYDWGKCSYSHTDYYTKAGSSDADIFQCVENGKLYVPFENELFQYAEPEEYK